MYDKKTKQQVIQIKNHYYRLNPDNNKIEGKLLAKYRVPLDDIVFDGNDKVFDIIENCEKTEKEIEYYVESKLNNNTNYLDIKGIFEAYPKVRNIMLITQRETGKSTSTRRLLDEGVLHASPIFKNILKQWNGKERRRASWWRKTYEAINTAVFGKFKKMVNDFNRENGNEDYKITKNGVFFKDDEEPVIAFINVNTPDNYKDTNGGCRINIFDEFLQTVDERGEKILISDEQKKYIDIYQGITRPGYRGGDKEDIPILILLTNPEQLPYSAWFDIFQIDFDGDKCNHINQYHINKDFRLFALGTAGFNIPDKQYRLGSINNISNLYPALSEKQKKVIGFYKVKDIFNPKFGYTINKSDFFIDYMEINGKIVLYAREIRILDGVEEQKKQTGKQQIEIPIFYSYDGESYNEFNNYDKEMFQELANFYETGGIYASTEYALDTLQKLAIKIITKDKFMR